MSSKQNSGYDSSDLELMRNFIPESDKMNIESVLKETKSFFEKDSRLLLLGGKSKIKMTKFDSQLISNKFSKNIEIGKQLIKVNSNSLVIIYKNLLSDMRIYYNNEYTTFLEKHELDVKNNLVLLPLYPVLVY